MSELIGRIECAPQTLVHGDCFLVTVTAPDGQSPSAQGTDVWINGVRGERQWLQAEQVGALPIVVTAQRGPDTDARTIDLEVGAVPVPPKGDTPEGIHTLLLDLGPGVPILQFGRASDAPYSATFTVFDGDRFADGMTSGIGRLSRTLAGRGLDGLAATAEVTPIAAPPAVPRDVIYAWDFGDGTTLTTTQPWVDHDFERSLGAEEATRSFDVSVQIPQRDGGTRTLTRTLCVHNAYVLCKQRGTIVPRRASTGFATPYGSVLSGSVVVENIEGQALTLDQLRIGPMLLDAEAEWGPVRAAGPFTIAANSTLAIPVNVDRADVPKDAVGFAVCFGGTAADGTPVRLETHFDITARDRGSDALRFDNLVFTHVDRLRSALGDYLRGDDPLPDNVKESVLAQADLQKLVVGFDRAPDVVHVEKNPIGGLLRQKLGGADRLHVAAPEVFVRPGNAFHKQARALTLSGAVRTSLADAILALDAPSIAELTLETVFGGKVRFDPKVVTLGGKDGVAVEGFECDPDNSDAPDGWACQATPEVQERIVPPRFLNARKGDIILSPGGAGMIGGLLMSLTPAQRYSHTGIMTKNYTEITHSTSSDGRIEDYPVGSILGDPYPTDGHRPDIVKYGWPGVIAQSVEEAVGGSWMVDPETAAKPVDQQKSYQIKAFTPGRSGIAVNGVWEMIPPLVVKPDPLLETPEIRSKLKKLADDARSDVGKSHYRVFAYSDARISFDPAKEGPADSGWAAGTYPTVCSSFLWTIARRNGIFLEGGHDPVTDADLEPVDRAGGAQVDARAWDGLYVYTEQERKDAGNYLYNFLHKKVMDKVGDEGVLGAIGEAFSDMADDVANQVCNAFASDWADTDAKDSDRWEEPGSGVAVSPDNILFWDAPTPAGPRAGGLYGYAEPLHYREARIEKVTVHRWKQVTKYATLHGRVTFHGNPLGGVVVQLVDGLTAISRADGSYSLPRVPWGDYRVKAGRDVDGVYASAEVSLGVDRDDVAFDIALSGPDVRFRRITVTGNAHIVDSETFGKDEIEDWPFGRDLDVGPFGTHQEFTFVHGMGGEVRIEIRVVVDWRLDNGANVHWEHRFFEGSSEDTDDLDGFQQGDLGLDADTWQSYQLKITSDDAGSSTVDITFANNLRPD